jgi:carboxyl-terminal processing protease
MWIALKSLAVASDRILATLYNVCRTLKGCAMHRNRMEGGLGLGTCSLLFTWLAYLAVLTALAQSQTMSNLERGEAQDMLRVVANDVRRHYYDPKLHGVDWDAAVARASQQIDKATSMETAFFYIAAALDTLNDSHTVFRPPIGYQRYDYGWEYQIIGERCYVTDVRPKSDAEAKGIHPGDEILTINGFLPDRSNLWKMQYLLTTLHPQPTLKLLLQLPGTGKSREVEVAAQIHQRKRPNDLSYSRARAIEERAREMRGRTAEISDELMISKLPFFGFENSAVLSMIGHARKHRTLILDLRGNPGGSEETLKFLVGALFDKDLKVADRVARSGVIPMKVKAQHNGFTGKLIVLVDSESGSASELLARVVQLEHRGIVLGDRTAGRVMESKFYQNRSGGGLVFYYGEMISDADLIMSDGKSLEHTGVTPDEVLLPTAADLAESRDPVLAHAAELAGVKLTPEAAGKLFPHEWPSPED